MDNIFNDLYPNKGEKIGTGIVGTATIGFFFGALRSAYKGEYDKAIFKAVVWHGLCLNTNHNFEVRLSRLHHGDHITR